MVNLQRRAGLGMFLALLGGGCAAPGEAVPPSRPVGTAVLTPWLTIAGGWRVDAAFGMPPGVLAPGLARPGVVSRLNLQMPVALAARDDIVLVADLGLRQLLRLERARDSLTPLSAIPFDTGLALHAAADGSVWLAEPASGIIRQFDRLGRVVRSWRNDRFAARPVAVVAPVESGGDIFVADAALAHVAVFDTFGQVIRRFGQGQLQSVAAMCVGPLGLYLVDRLAQQVKVFGRDGRWLLSFGDETLVMPRAVAVDHAGRVFVSDEADGAIHVFVDGEHFEKFGGATSARPGRIDALAVDGNLLYVADSLASQVRILLITPQSLLRKPQS